MQTETYEEADTQKIKDNDSVKIIVSCENENCTLRAHFFKIESNEVIFKIPIFKGMTCLGFT